jgi:hypothetical protein
MDFETTAIIMVVAFFGFVAFMICVTRLQQRNQMNGVAYYAAPPAVIGGAPGQSQGSYPPRPAGYHQPPTSVAMVTLPGGPQPVGYYQPQGSVPLAPYSEGHLTSDYYQPQTAAPMVAYPTATVVFAEPMDISTRAASQPAGRW